MHPCSQSYDTSTYDAVKGTMVVPPGLNGGANLNTKQLRIPEMVINAQMEKYSVDFGIQHNQMGTAGWRAFCFAVTDNTGCTQQNYLPKISSVDFQVTAVRTAAAQDVVTGTFTFRSTTGSVTTQTIQKAWPAGTFWSTNSHVVRWARFMSFLPNNGASSATKDTADGSYMKGAQFIALKLRRAGSSPATWTAWTASLIEHAWSVQTANINPLKIGGLTTTTPSDGDSFNAIHQLFYGKRCVQVDNK